MNTGPSLPVSVVVVNYNGRDLLRPCLDSLLAQRSRASRIVVVDNGSEDGSVIMLENEYSGLADVLALPENLGFAGGNNRGVALCDTEWIALLNNDAVADPDWLCRMMDRSHGEDVGMVASNILVADSRDRIDNQGVALFADGMSRGAMHYRRAGSSVCRDALLPSGCAVMIKRELFDRAGGFDESFFCYSEDTDLFLRMRMMGHGCAFASDAVVYHNSGGGTLGSVSPMKIYLVERNRIAVLLRYYPLSSILLSPAYTLMRYAGLLAATSGLALSGRSKSNERDRDKHGGPLRGGLVEMIGALLRAWLDGLARAPKDIGVRRRLHKTSAAPPGAMRRWLEVYGLDRESLFKLSL